MGIQDSGIAGSSCTVLRNVAVEVQSEESQVSSSVLFAWGLIVTCAVGPRGTRIASWLLFGGEGKPRNEHFKVVHVLFPHKFGHKSVFEPICDYCRTLFQPLPMARAVPPQQPMASYMGRDSGA